jgi:hypothetical protein
MKGMSFKLIADLLIALVAVWVILTVMNLFIPNYTGTALCKLYQAILVIPLPQSLKPSVSQCELTPTREDVTLSPQTYGEMTSKIADYVWSCWSDKANNGKGGISFSCYQILIRNVPAAFGEKEITDILKSRGKCSSIENNFLEFEQQPYDCGSQNKIYWNGGRVSTNDSEVFINYDSFFHRIEVAV